MDSMVDGALQCASFTHSPPPLFQVLTRSSLLPQIYKAYSSDITSTAPKRICISPTVVLFGSRFIHTQGVNRFPQVTGTFDGLPLQTTGSRQIVVVVGPKKMIVAPQSEDTVESYMSFEQGSSRQTSPDPFNWLSSRTTQDALSNTLSISHEHVSYYVPCYDINKHTARHLLASSDSSWTRRDRTRRHVY